MNDKVTVYSKDNCFGCGATKRKLDQEGIEYIEKNVDHDEAARDKVIALGFMQMPVVVTPTDSWYGYDPTRIENINR